MANFICTNPRTIEHESNDCTVRASTIASGLPYKRVHKIYASVGRENGKGVVMYQVVKALKKITKKDLIGYNYTYCRNYPTLSYFLKHTGKEGSWVVIKKNHAFAVKDGTVYDVMPMRGNVRIWACFKLKG